jgi:phosphate transport system substrate-binding protein
MSGHHSPPQHNHAPYPAMRAAAAAMIVLTLGACGSAGTISTNSAVAPTASFGPGGHGVTLTGAGSTFDAPFFDKAFAKYQQQHSTVSIRYAAIGSSAGIAAFSARKLNFGASDAPMTASEQAAASGGPSVQVPVDLGGEAVAYNLSLPRGQRLHLTGPVIARIFLGQITHWNDPAIAALNRGINLPDAPITVVHRSDGSGTTYIFSNYLSTVDPTWAAKVGTGKSLNWPTGEGEEGNASVSSTVFSTPFSIGYLEVSYTRDFDLPIAQIRNQAGHYVTPSTATIGAAAAQKPHITAANFSIVNQPGANSYPISGYSWALLYTHQPSQATGHALVSLFQWLTHTGQAYASQEGYVPLPPNIQQLAQSTLQHVS